MRKTFVPLALFHGMSYPVRMTAQEKHALHELLKVSAAHLFGYVPAAFAADEAAHRCDAGGPGLDEINKMVAACTGCALSRTRTNVVPGTGVPCPAVLVVGEGPGAEEDARGLPFVGPAGQLLDRMLAAIHLSRSTNCYIANIVKCRPPGNRTPSMEEVAACEPFLKAQIHALKPRMILAMGRTAAQALLKTDQGISRLRGKFFAVDGIPIMATYHPSALLRNAELKAPAWEDLKAFARELGRQNGH